MLYYKNKTNKLLTENELRQICENSGGSFCGRIFYEWLQNLLDKGLLQKISTEEAMEIAPLRVAYYEGR